MVVFGWFLCKILFLMLLYVYTVSATSYEILEKKFKRSSVFLGVLNIYVL